MADVKISELTALAALADNDQIEAVDKDDLTIAPTGTNKYLTPTVLRAYLDGFYTGAAHAADGTIHFTEASITHNNVGGRTTADAHPTSAITGLDATLSDAARLTARNDFTRAADAAVDNDYFQTGQIAQSGRFRLESASGFLTITGRNDSGAQVGNALLGIAHGNNIAAQGLIIGNVAFPGAGALAAENGLYDGTSRVLTDVIQDTTPQLGGNLETKGQSISLTRGDDSVHGIIEALTTRSGAAIAFSDGTAYEEGDAAVTVEANGTILWGSAAAVASLQHTVSGGRQVYVSELGILYGVDPPPVGWTSSDTSTTTASMGSGTGAGAWIDTDLTINFGADVEIGQRLDVSVNLYIENRTDDKPGNISVGFGFDSATPTSPDATVTIGEYFEGWVPVSFSTTADAAYTTANTVDIFVRRESSDDSNFNPWIAYEGTTPHEGILSTPGGSSPGGSGDMVAPGTMSAGNFYESTADPKITADAGFGPADTARLSQANIFTSDQTISEAGGTVKLTLQSTDNQVPMRYDVGGGTPDQRDWTVLASDSGQYRVLSVQDDGTGGIEQFSAEHSGFGGGFRVGAGAVYQGTGTINTDGIIYQAATPIIHPTAIVMTTSSGYTPSLDLGEAPRIHVTGDATLNPPIGAEGSMEVVVDANVNLSLGAFDEVLGSRTLTARQTAVVFAANGIRIFAWGSAGS